MSAIRVAILTISDSASRGDRADLSGLAIRELVRTIGAEVLSHEVIPDEALQISERLSAWCDTDAVDLVLTTGGTGLGPRDVTPEATLAVADRVVPGIAEAMRVDGIRHTPRAMLSRSAAVVRKRALIVNLPGSERAVRESLGAIIDVLPHAVELLHGDTEHNQPAM